MICTWLKSQTKKENAETKKSSDEKRSKSTNTNGPKKEN